MCLTSLLASVLNNLGKGPWPRSLIRAVDNATWTTFTMFGQDALTGAPRFNHHSLLHTDMRNRPLQPLPLQQFVRAAEDLIDIYHPITPAGVNVTIQQIQSAIFAANELTCTNAIHRRNDRLPLRALQNLTNLLVNDGQFIYNQWKAVSEEFVTYRNKTHQDFRLQPLRSTYGL